MGEGKGGKTDRGEMEVCLLFVGCLTSQQHASVSLHNFTCCHTEKLQIQLSTSPSHSILTLGGPVPALTL